jgi:hypothetical protein
MTKFAIVRLGKDSVADIKSIDALNASPTTPLSFEVKCSQVPEELALGDFVFVCLGSDNNNGTPTEWIRGVRALGTVTAKSGGPRYSDQWQVGLEVKVVLPESITKKDLLAAEPAAYFWASDVPVLGVDTHSNQTVQMIKTAEDHQKVEALAYVLTAIHPSFKTDTIAAYPALAPWFSYIPPSPKNATGASAAATPSTASLFPPASLSDIVAQFVNDAEKASLRVKQPEAHRFIASLLSKRFLIATGLAGSGKTKLAQAFATWLTPSSTASDPFAVGAKVESDRTTYFVKASGPEFVEFWNNEDEASATKVGLPRKMIEEWADHIAAKALPASTAARDIREAVKAESKYSDQLHSFETHLKSAAFALLASRGAKKPVKRYEVVSVGADWTGSENILGYPNGLDASSYMSKPALDLILQAERNPVEPHFLILDEMNLSHVERYFADVLSSIESGELIHLHRDGERKADGVLVPKAVGLPKNLFIIGTVNVDETTYMFSPKVLDRANVIEFRMSESELSSFLSTPIKPDLALMAGKGEAYGHEVVEAASGSLAQFSDPLKSQFELEMLMFFKALSAGGSEFGYRVAHEAARFVQAYKQLGSHGDSDVAWFDGAFDYVVAQKFLPKLHGSRAKLGPLLKKLWFLCVNSESKSGAELMQALEAVARSTEKQHEPSSSIPDDAPFKVSAEKIGRMWRLLNDNGFASFAEA